ncbi:MAG: hypothetical protein HYW70_01200 [Candidatus Nealsonbacteria bacterium]|nr:hypothetical protein [Candidatus Nealsonbacteria bacterium]
MKKEEKIYYAFSPLAAFLLLVYFFWVLEPIRSELSGFTMGAASFFFVALIGSTLFLGGRIIFHENKKIPRPVGAIYFAAVFFLLASHPWIQIIFLIILLSTYPAIAALSRLYKFLQNYILLEKNNAELRRENEILQKYCKRLKGTILP